MSTKHRKQRATREGGEHVPQLAPPAQPEEIWFERVSALYPPRVVDWIRRVRAARNPR